ncbi:hypothetical protein [Hahella ganghwensis]|uniref:hypothetical protein n=1 Tax=Hahella ganghwensis TaxID=286420 RepID=UPI00037F936A|nr:hypothetical protein [Hahella ganghwensis]
MGEVQPFGFVDLHFCMGGAEDEVSSGEAVSSRAEVHSEVEKERRAAESLGNIKIENLPFKEKTSGGGPENAYLIMSALAAIALFSLWIGRKYLIKQGLAMSSPEKIKYVSNRRLNSKTYAYILEVSNQKYLVVENQNHIAMSEIASNSEEAVKCPEQESVS